MAVPDQVVEDDVVSLQSIPAGTFAVQRVACTCTEAESAWNWLTSTWLAAKGLTCELMRSYEAYPVVDGRCHGPEDGMELCLRLRSS